VQVWFAGNNTPTTISVTVNSYPFSVFAPNTNDIYIGNNNDVEKHTLNDTSSVSTLNTGGECYGLFIDSNNSLYCVLYNSHKVIKRSLNSSDTQTTTVAGTGCSGFLLNMLYVPQGIFVDNNFNLYVADTGNSRIQFFYSGRPNATTVAGNGAPGTISLSAPTDVLLDADGYLFIVDNGNCRIVGSGPNGFRCVVGCSGWGSSANQLAAPQSMAFDTYGNIFVSDTFNSRIQKFVLATNSCSEYCSMSL
jgi:hypothetical protein